MKHITITTLTLIAIISCTTMIQADLNPFRANHHTKKNKTSITKFTPDNAFGGVDAQGQYKKRGKTAIISYDQAIYEFNTIIEDPNPILHNNKLDLVRLGFFSDHTNSKKMPVTTYIFGAPTNDAAIQAAQLHALKFADQEQSNTVTMMDNATALDSIQFKPSKQFAGHDLIGLYINTTHEAMISDPSGQNNKKYDFINVQEELPSSLKSNNVRPLEKPMFIGSYTAAPQCSKGTPQVCTIKVKRTNLYGNLKK